MPDVDWSLYQQCPLCFAELGKPCWAITGSLNVEAKEPHSTRPLRAAAAREADS